MLGLAPSSAQEKWENNNRKTTAHRPSLVFFVPGDMIRTYRPPRDRCTRRKRASRASWRTLNESCGLCRRQRAGSRRALSPAQSRSRLAAASTEADEAALERRFGALLPCAIAPKRSKAARSAPLGCRVALHRRGALVLLTHPARASGRLRAPRSRSRRSVRPARLVGQRALQHGAGAASASRLPRASTPFGCNPAEKGADKIACA